MTLDLETFKRDIVENIRRTLTTLDYKSLGNMVDGVKEHADYPEEFCQRMLSYTVTALIVRLLREEEARRLSTN